MTDVKKPAHVLHREFVDSLSDADLRAGADVIVFDPQYEDRKSIVGTYSPLRVTYDLDGIDGDGES